MGLQRRLLLSATALLAIVMPATANARPPSSTPTVTQLVTGLASGQAEVTRSQPRKAPSLSAENPIHSSARFLVDWGERWMLPPAEHRWTK